MAYSEDVPTLLGGEVEFEEAYFCGKREGKKSREAVGKVLVFDILKSDGPVYVQIVPDVCSETVS